MENSQTEGVKNAINKFKKLDFWHQQHFNVTVEITDIKCRLLSKYLFQRTLQHGGNAQFV